ncbi:hypothetical protein GCM10009679_79060 [Saccharothrix algeriensis]
MTATSAHRPWSPTRRSLLTAGLSALALVTTAAGAVAAPAAPPVAPPPANGLGHLDPPFGANGTVVTTFPDLASGASAIAVHGDGFVAAGGSLQDDSPDFLLARYRADGRLDRRFGTGGQVVTPFSAVAGADGAEGVAVQRDRRIVAVGTAGLGTDSDIGFAFARYREDGRLDRGFGGGDGIAVLPVGPAGDSGAADVAVQRDGRIVAVGGANDAAGNAVFAAVRLLPDGRPDPSFGDGGTALVLIPGGDAAASAVALQPDGRIVLAGTAIGPGLTGQQFAVVRLTDRGVPDSTFGEDGIAVAQNQPEQGKGGAEDVVVGRDGRILVAGLGQNAAGQGAFGLVRFLPDGSPDPSFGGGTGLVLTEFPEGESVAASVLLRRDGRIVAVGSAGFPSRFALAGYLPDGTLDPAFGSCGRTTTVIGEGSGATGAVLLDRGAVVAAGSTFDSTQTNGGFALARYLGDPRRPQRPAEAAAPVAAGLAAPVCLG